MRTERRCACCPAAGLRAGLVALCSPRSRSRPPRSCSRSGSDHPRRGGGAAGGHLGGLSPRFASPDMVPSASRARGWRSAGLHAASRSLTKAAAAGVAAADQSTAAAQAAPAPHYLSSTDLTSLADRASGYQPASYLIRDYKSVAARYADPVARARRGRIHPGRLRERDRRATRHRAERALGAEVQASGRVAVNARLLARATAAASQPSAEPGTRRQAAGRRWRGAEPGCRPSPPS